MSISRVQIAVKHLRVLDLEPGATLLQVKHAYRTLTKVWHPDRFSSDPKLQGIAQEKLKVINGAYEWLTSNADVLPRTVNDDANRSPDGKRVDPEDHPKSETSRPRPQSPPPNRRKNRPPQAQTPHTSDPREKQKGRKGVYVAFAVAAIALVIWINSVERARDDERAYDVVDPVTTIPPTTSAQPPAPSPVVPKPTAASQTTEMEAESKREHGVQPGPARKQSTAHDQQAVESAPVPIDALMPAVEEDGFEGVARKDRPSGSLNLSDLSREEKTSIEAACSQAKYLEGPAAYNECLASQLRRLQTGVRRPELSGLLREEHTSIEAACSQDKFLNGPADYNYCLTRQFQKLTSSIRRPDLSRLSRDELTSIEAACSQAKFLEGPAAYNKCLASQLARLKDAPGRPDLSMLTRNERTSIEAVCSQAKFLEGPAAYNECLRRQLLALGINQ
jgi:hypothetical protein